MILPPLPPHPDRWTAGTLDLAPGPAPDGTPGHYGTWILDGVRIHVRGWRRCGDGVAFEGQHESDAGYEAMAAELGGRTRG